MSMSNWLLLWVNFFNRCHAFPIFSLKRKIVDIVWHRWKLERFIETEYSAFCQPRSTSNKISKTMMKMMSAKCSSILGVFTNFTRYHISFHLGTISNGNRTEWSPIWSVIVRETTKSDDHEAGGVYHEYFFLFITTMITDRIGRHDVLLPINHKNCNFQEKKNSQIISWEKGKIYIKKLRMET